MIGTNDSEVLLVNRCWYIAEPIFFGVHHLIDFIAGNDKMRNIYKSLIVTSFTVVFGYFTTTFIGTAAQVLNLDIPRAYVDLFAGTFVTTTCSFNIFVYYFIRIRKQLHKSHSSSCSIVRVL
ncbi:unnamed protein product [Haemonchus placei]|uniref:Aa_trans domain-containing protein n=1 Tax=Haemonchus placei TaxID=6290 RepID=A0A0N4WH68_HAEPC|nr:unnamed protein product [Haemonchus placei]